MNTLVHHEPVMGTVVSFDVRSPDPQAAPAAVADAVDWLHWVDRTFSTYRADSQISRLGRGELAEAACSPEVGGILALCERLRDATGGFFDARAGGRLDPSGVVKGWSVDRASAILLAAGCADHVIAAGGDIRLRGRPAPGKDWHVGVTHPAQLDAYCAALHLAEGAVATSGTYRRGPHVIDPHRRRPATELAAVTVVGPNLTQADAFATAALAMGWQAPAWLDQLADHQALVIGADGRSWQTAGFARYRLDVAAV